MFSGISVVRLMLLSLEMVFFLVFEVLSRILKVFLRRFWRISYFGDSGIVNISMVRYIEGIVSIFNMNFYLICTGSLAKK